MSRFHQECSGRLPADGRMRRRRRLLSIEARPGETVTERHCAELLYIMVSARRSKTSQVFSCRCARRQRRACFLGAPRHRHGAQHFHIEYSARIMVSTVFPAIRCATAVRACLCWNVEAAPTALPLINLDGGSLLLDVTAFRVDDGTDTVCMRQAHFVLLHEGDNGELPQR